MPSSLSKATVDAAGKGQVPVYLFHVEASSMELVQELLPPGPVDGGGSLLQGLVLTAALLPAQLPGDRFPHKDEICSRKMELVAGSSKALIRERLRL